MEATSKVLACGVYILEKRSVCFLNTKKLSVIRSVTLLILKLCCWVQSKCKTKGLKSCISFNFTIGRVFQLLGGTRLVTCATQLLDKVEDCVVYYKIDG